MNVIELLPTIGPYAFSLLVYLMSIADDSGNCAPGYTDMRRATGFTNHHVSAALTSLENNELIRRDKGYQTITKIVLFPQNSNYQNSRILELTTTSLINLKSSSILQNLEFCNSVEAEPELPSLGPLSSAFVGATHIPELTGGPKVWIDALNEMQKAGVEPADITTAVDELRNRGYSIASLKSIVRPAIMAMSKRKSNGHKQQEALNEYVLAT